MSGILLRILVVSYLDDAGADLFIFGFFAFCEALCKAKFPCLWMMEVSKATRTQGTEERNACEIQ